MNLTVEEFIVNNRGIIVKLATRYTNTDFGIEFDDLFQVACLKLLENYHNYDASKGSISTYAYHLTYYAILNYIKENTAIAHISKELLTASDRLLRQNVSFYKENGRIMTESEAIDWIINVIPKENYVDAKKYYHKLNYIISYHLNRQYYSIENELEKYTIDEYYDSTIEKKLVSNCNVEEEAISKITIENFIRSLTYLSPSQKEIFLEKLGLIDGIPKTDRDLSVRYDVSVKTINAGYNRALKKIKERKCKTDLILL